MSTFLLLTKSCGKEPSFSCCEIPLREYLSPCEYLLCHRRHLELESAQVKMVAESYIDIQFGSALLDLHADDAERFRFLSVSFYRYSSSS
jgi:hypothetical protein